MSSLLLTLLCKLLKELSKRLVLMLVSLSLLLRFARNMVLTQLKESYHTRLKSILLMATKSSSIKNLLSKKQKNSSLLLVTYSVQISMCHLVRASQRKVITGQLCLRESLMLLIILRFRVPEPSLVRSTRSIPLYPSQLPALKILLLLEQE